MILIKTSSDDEAFFQQLVAKAVEQGKLPSWIPEFLARNDHEVVGVVLKNNPPEPVELFTDVEYGREHHIRTISNRESACLGDFGPRIVNGKDMLYSFMERFLATGAR